jgi:hypothetical protein
MKYKRSRELISEALLQLYPNKCAVNRLAKQLVEKKDKWFEGWHYEETFVKKNKSFEFRLSNGTKITFSEKEMGDNRYKALTDIILSAFDQIQRDNGGYKK